MKADRRMMMWSTSIICLLFLYVLPLQNHVEAALLVELRMVPEVTEAITLGDGLDQLTLIARVNLEDVEYQWTIDGPGSVEGELTARKIIYHLPQQLDTPAEVVISVTVTDSQGETATETATITLLAEAASSAPSPTPTPEPSQPEEIDPKLQALLQQADQYFRRTFFVEPAEGNAFDGYKEVLRRDPENAHAREQLHSIIQHYKDWGDTAYEQGEHRKAHDYYQRHQLVARYVMDELGERSVQADIQAVQQRIEQLQPFLTPPTPTPTATPQPTATPIATPTPVPTATPLPTVPPATPTPTAIPTPTPAPEILEPWSPSCPPMSQSLEELLQTILPNHLEDYKELKAREQQGEAVEEQIVVILEQLICDLLAIEKIFQDNYAQTQDEKVFQRIQRLQQTRKAFEQEVLARLGRK